MKSVTRWRAISGAARAAVKSEETAAETNDRQREEKKKRLTFYCDAKHKPTPIKVVSNWRPSIRGFLLRSSPSGASRWRTPAGIMKEKMSPSVSTLIVILYWTVARCHVGAIGGDVEVRITLARILSICPFFLFRRKKDSPFIPLPTSLFFFFFFLSRSFSPFPENLSFTRPTGDIFEKETPNERAMENRLYNYIIHGTTRRSRSMDQPAMPLHLFLPPSLPLFRSLSPFLFLSSSSSLLAIVTPAAS